MYVCAAVKTACAVISTCDLSDRTWSDGLLDYFFIIGNIQLAPCKLFVGTSPAYRNNYNMSKSYTIVLGMGLQYDTHVSFKIHVKKEEHKIQLTENTF